MGSKNAVDHSPYASIARSQRGRLGLDVIALVVVALITASCKNPARLPRSAATCRVLREVTEGPRRADVFDSTGEYRRELFGGLRGAREDFIERLWAVSPPEDQNAIALTYEAVRGAYTASVTRHGMSESDARARFDRFEPAIIAAAAGGFLDGCSNEKRSVIYRLAEGDCEQN
jgi:hypothetical protein